MILTTEQETVLKDWKHEPVILTIAPAGTGKSELAQRVALEAIEEGYSVQCLGFGKKDTRNFKEKLIELGVSDKDAKVGTVHSRCYWIMMQAAHKKLNNYDRFLDGRSLRVYSGKRRTKLMQEAICKVVANPSKLVFKELPQTIELIKAIGATPEAKGEIIQSRQPNTFVSADDPAVTWHVYAEYQRLLDRDNAMDFGDYMILTKQVLIQDQEIREKTSPELLIVDEAHDLSIAQWEVVRLLTYKPEVEVNENHPILGEAATVITYKPAADNKRIRVFGDPCQQLYEFRGALGSALPNKMKDYFGGYKEITLTRNFRSAPEIIAHSEGIIPRGVVADLKVNGVVKVINVPYTNSMEHANDIATEIQTLIQEGIEYKDIVILCSVTHLYPPLELYLNKLDIPYQKGNVNWYNRPEIRELVAWARMANPLHMSNVPYYKKYEQSFQRQHPFLWCYNAPPIKLMDAEGGEILNQDGEARYLNETWLRHHFWSKNGRETTVEARLNPIKYPPQYRRAIRHLYGNIQEVQTKKSPYEVIQWVLNSMKPEWKKFHEARSVEDTDPYAYVQTLLDIAKECKNGDFLEKLIELESNKDSVDAVTLSTIHGSKGLEWKAVFVVLCPLDFADQEQELAKHYVSTTRAKEYLHESIAAHLALGVPRYDTYSDEQKILYTKSTMTWYNQYQN